MAKHRVVVCCWLHGHETELTQTVKQEEKLMRQVQTLKAVCPVCRDNEDGNVSIFIKSGETVFNNVNFYTCRHGHVTTVGAFGNGKLHVKFGNNQKDFINIDGTIQELEELINNKDISCHHEGKKGECGCKLKVTNDSNISYPSAVSFKTKTRVGDVWDKAGVNPVRNGGYDGDGHYRATKTEAANIQRLKRMRRKRQIAEDKHPGKRIDKPTDRKYKRRSRGEINTD